MWGFLVGKVVACYVILRLHYRERSKVLYNAEMAYILKTIWFQMAVAGVMTLAGVYLSRFILSAIHIMITVSLIVLSGIAVMPVVFKAFRSFTVQIMFPKFGEDSAGLFDILVWAIPVQTLIGFSQPVVIKLAPVWVAPIINVAGMAATLLPTILLILGYATRGPYWVIITEVKS